MSLIQKDTGYFSSFDQTNIYYETRGQGEAIIFVYGIGCLINHWHHQVKFFSAKYKVITFDIRGHHQSSKILDPANINIKSIAQDLELLMNHLKIDSAHFVGHSFGVPVLFEAFSLFPDKFLSLVVINGFSKNPIKGMFGLDIVEPFFHWIKKQFNHSPVMLTELWKLAIYNPVSMRMAALAGGFNLKLTHFKDIEVYAKGVAELDLTVFLSLFEDMMSFDGDEILEKINIPTLIISGENDNVTPKKFQESMSEKIKNSEFVTVPYGSHCTQLDFPDYINLKIEWFLSQHLK